MVIQYSQCWEDPEIMMRALDIRENDSILSIGSGGENSLALLLKKPQFVTIIDKNPLQNFLIELKIKAIEKLDHTAFLEFIGIYESINRIEIYDSLKSEISKNARLHWDINIDSIEQGIIHIGKFEKYFRLFRNNVLPLIHSKNTVKKLFQSLTKEEQIQFYDSTWNNIRWRCIFKVFFSRLLLGRLGRHPSFFKHVSLNSISEILLERSKSGLTDTPVKGNYFLEYILNGNYCDPEQSHPYLNKKNFETIKGRLDRIKLVNAGIDEYLSNHPSKYSKFNLSDIFEYMSENVFKKVLDSIIMSSDKDASLAYWTLFVPRKVPDAYKYKLIYHQEISEELYKQSKTFFYGSFNLLTVNK